MNFEDPLAGILSDGSDDSFFDDDILGNKKPAKTKGATTNAEKMNAIFDLGEDQINISKSIEIKKESLFDLNKKEPQELKLNPTSPASVKRTAPKDSHKFLSSDVIMSPTKSKATGSADKLDFLQEPRKETGKSLDKGKSSQSILDNILGDTHKKLGSSQTVNRPATATKKDFDLDSFLGSETSKTVPNKNVSQKQKQDNRKEESAAPKKKSSDDWLGLFQEKSDADENKPTMPSWLGGDGKKEKRSDVKKADKDELKKDELKEDEKNKNEVTKMANATDNEIVAAETVHIVPNLNILQGSNEDITTEGATIYLQQQEAQLMVAMQLKAQEEKLAAMQLRQKESQRVQREAAFAHNAHLDAILKKQMENRQQMQAIIASHQDRITQRIKALLNTEATTDIINEATEEFENPITDKSETTHSRERKQLLQLVQSLQENHDKEIDLMETSYRRQLAFLEVSLNQSEERMKEESDKLVKFYTEKINWLEEHHHLYKKLTLENLNALTERHKSENEMLRQQHLENVKVLQEHHAALMENIKSAVKHEQVLVQDAAGFSSDLHELVVDVRDSKSQCQNILDKVQELVKDTQQDVAKSLQTREIQINDMIQQLKKEREYFEVEKTESREIVKTLETRLKQMTTMVEEETAILKQRKMEFEFEKATFSKQTEFAKNTLKKQDEDIKALKEDIQKEYLERITKIDEEKKKIIKENTDIAKEKVSVATIKQELEKMKAELQAQLEQVTEESSKLNIEKQEMHMEKQRILAKSRDLDILAKAAVEKQGQADKKYSDAENLQGKYEERLHRLQEHVVSLNSREKQIAKEKVVLSRERLTLHNERKQHEGRQQCSLCKSSQNITYNLEAGYSTPEPFAIPVLRDARDVPVNSAMNAIEQEMANLMGRSFNLKHTIGTRNLNSDYTRRFMNSEMDENVPNLDTPSKSEGLKDYMDPKFMMLRLDVQKVLSNLNQPLDVEEHLNRIDI